MEHKRLLIVEDDDDLRESLVVSLDEEYDLCVAPDGAKAVQCIEHGFRPDMILLDYQIPPPSGRELIDALHDRGLAGIPVLLMSACDDIRVLARELGAPDCINKPFKLSVLRDKLNRLGFAH